MHTSVNTTDITPQIYARSAGLLYLIIIVCGITGEVFIRSSLIVTGDATATASNIINSQGLFKLGLLFDLIMLISDVAIAVLFYALLKPVSKTLALMAAAFRLTQAAILGFNLLNYYAAFLLLNDTTGVTVFNAQQINAMALLFITLHSYGYDLGLIFFAFSSVVLGYLLIRADYFPAFLGYGLIAAAAVYLSGSLMRFILPEYLSAMQPAYVIPLLAELSFCLWLLVTGVKYE